MAKVSRPVVYTGLLAVVVAAFVLTAEDPAATASGRKRKPKAAASKSVTVFLKEDYLANESGKQFASVGAPMRNVFRPLIVRQDSGHLPTSDFEMGVPSGLVGEPGWAYTGMAEVDGVPTALLENSRTGDGVFLKQGEVWKGATVYRITPEQLVLMSKTGVARTVKVNAPQEGIIGGPGGFAPVSPPISGPIGRGLAVQPEPTRERPNVARRGPRNMPTGQDGTGVGDEN